MAKARDIVSDWPRGRSTLGPYGPDNHVVPGVSALVSRYESSSDRIQALVDAIGDQQYHKAQQQMVDDFHRMETRKALHMFLLYSENASWERKISTILAFPSIPEHVWALWYIACEQTRKAGI